MVKKTLCRLGVLVFCLSVFSGGALSEPLTLEQPEPVVRTKQLEAGIFDLSYSVDKWEIKNVRGIDYEFKQTRIPLSARLGLGDKYELSASIPYYKWEYSQTSIPDSDESGIGDIQLGIKKCFYSSDEFKFGAGLKLSLPTGDPDKSLGEGFNTGLILAAQMPAGPFNAVINAGYLMTSEYEIRINNQDVKINPGEQILYGVGLILPCSFSDKIDWILEMNGRSVSKRKEAGYDVDYSAGNAFDIIPGFRYNNGNLKTKLGVAIAAGSEDNRLYDRMYDWKLIAGISYLFNF